MADSPASRNFRRACWAHARPREQRGVLLQSVGMHVALVPREERLRSLLGRVPRREVEDRERGRRIADGHPEVTSGHRVATDLGISTSRVVGPNHTRFQDSSAHQVTKRFQQRGRLSHPVAQCALGDLDPAAGDDSCLTGQRQVVGELARQDVRQQPRSAQPLGDGADRCRSRGHAPFLGRDVARLARPANVGLAGRLAHEEGDGVAVELLDRVGADAHSLLSAARTVLLVAGQVVDDFAAFEVGGQR